MKITNKPRTENYTSENIDLFVQKNSEADSRLIDYQDNTPAHIILKTDDLICEKTKNQTNLDVGLSGFIRSKGNLDVASKILYQIFFCTNKRRKIFKKNNEKNKSFILPLQTSVNYCISWYIAMSFISVSFILLWFCSQSFPFSH